MAKTIPPIPYLNSERSFAEMFNLMQEWIVEANEAIGSSPVLDDACDICGAAIIDTEKHAKWHKSNVARGILGGGMFDRG